jgi:hypothetical protein
VGRCCPSAPPAQRSTFSGHPTSGYLAKTKKRLKYAVKHCDSPTLATTQIAWGVTREGLQADERDLGHPDIMSGMMFSQLLRQPLVVRVGNASPLGRLVLLAVQLSQTSRFNLFTRKS